MAKCWTCGSYTEGYNYTCSSCQSLTEIKSLQKKVESFGGYIPERINYMAQVQQEGFNALNDTLSKGLSQIVTAIEWGFEELNWELQLQTEVLRSIDYTLKTPGETQANEWRIMAEKLKSRWVLDQSEEFYLKALVKNPLDYRIYVGLAETYLKTNKFDKAKIYLEKSLPHAPEKEINFKSYSFRLIGHIHACNEDYYQAVEILGYSIELSPNYADGHYDYAQYCAQLKREKSCLSSLQKAIDANSLYYYLSLHEINFNPLRQEVSRFTMELLKNASKKAKDSILNAENILNEANGLISKSRQTLIMSKIVDERKTIDELTTIYDKAMVKLKLAKDNVASGDYKAILEAKTNSEESTNLGNNVIKTLQFRLKNYEDKRSRRIREAWEELPGDLLAFLIIGSGCGIIAGVVIGILLIIMGLFGHRITYLFVIEVVIFIFFVVVSIMFLFPIMDFKNAHKK